MSRVIGLYLSLPAMILLTAALPGCDKSGSDDIFDPSIKSKKSADNQSGNNRGRSPKIPVVQRPALPQGWTDFSDRENGFSIYTPSRPRGNRTFMTPDGTRSPKIYGGLGHGLRFNLSYFERPQSQVATIRQQLYSRGPTSLRTLGNQTARREVTWGGQSAVEFEMRRGQTITVLRILVSGNRFYSAWISGRNGHPTQEEHRAFFESFTLQ